MMMLREKVTEGSKTVTVSGRGPVDFNGKEAAFEFEIPTLGAVNMRVISPMFYLELPARDRAQIPGHKPWVSFNLDTLSNARFGATFTHLSSSSQTPTQTLSYLQSVSTSGINRVGTAKLGGVAVTQYDATVDLSKVAATKDAAARAAVTKLQKELHRSTYPMQVWIDSANRVRQIAYQISIPGTASAPTGNISLTVGFSGFGADIHLAAPAASQTYSLTWQILHAGTATS